MFKFWEGFDGSSDLFCTILFWTKTSFGPVNISENDLGVGVDFTMIVFSSFFGFFTSEAEIIMLLFVELISMSAFLTSSSFSLSASKGWNTFKILQKYIEINKKSCYVMQIKYEFLKRNVLPRLEPGKESHNECTGVIYNDEKRDKSRHNINRFFFMLLGLHLQLGWCNSNNNTFIQFDG